MEVINRILEGKYEKLEYADEKQFETLLKIRQLELLESIAKSLERLAHNSNNSGCYP